MSKKILICEKNRTLSLMMKAKLEASGYKVLFVADGKSAIEIIKKDRSINLIITELLIPFLTGLELINYIRKNLKLRTPILVISNNIEQAKIDSFNLGANEYMSKPLSMDELAVRVEKLLN
jgi:DNA-binding response OmpR family regulator